MKKKKVTFPHMGSYHVVFEYLARKTLDFEVLVPPPITKKTLELGAKYSPEFVCIPFKYNLGNYIEALELGADIILQAGGGCRFGYYGEIQEQILKDLGYNFEFIDICSSGKVTPITLFKSFRKLNNKLSFFKFLYYVLLAIKMAYILDEIEFYIRENVGFEKEKGSFERLRKKFLEDLKHTNGFIDLLKLKRNYLKLFKSIETDKPKNPIRIGVLGELYVLMEPFSNYFIEKELAQKGIQVTRFMNITYLLFEKAKLEKKLLKNAGKYLKYPIGADGTDSVARTKILAELGFDGIIHIKPFGCTPEVNAIPILQNLSNDYKIPILYFSFDAHTSETGVKTRLEAFYDMLLMRKEKRYD